MSFLDTITKLAGTVGEALSGNALPAVVEIGKDVINLIEEAKTDVSTNDVAVLEATLADLEPKVMAHADTTEQELRGS